MTKPRKYKCVDCKQPSTAKRCHACRSKRSEITITQEEFDQRKAEIQSQWTKKERNRRIAGPRGDWKLPTISDL